MRYLTIALLGAALLSLSPVQAADYFPPKGDGWARHTPQQEKFDPTKLKAAIDYAISAELKYSPELAKVANIDLPADGFTHVLTEAGLPAELATKLARETVAGSGELLHRSDLPSATLRQNVTSPGGTTAAALEVLMGPGGFDALLKQAVAAAAKRSKELAG